MKKRAHYKNLPDSPGVYLMKDARGAILYIGKAGNLRRRVSSYFERPRNSRIEQLVQKISKVNYEKTGTALEALILEAELIKKFQPPFNVREKDDASFLYVEITKEYFPRVLLVRGKEEARGLRYGPFTSASNIREAMKILRRIFPWSVHDPSKIGRFNRPCLDYELGLCPGACVGAIDRESYSRNVKNLKLIFDGKKKKVLTSLRKEMVALSGKLEFEKAEKVRRQIFGLQHIQDVAMITEEGGPQFVKGKNGFRVEGYDISNISGSSAVGSMVVFVDGRPDKDQYRKFRIRIFGKPDDTGMLKEILARRLRHREWALPDIILIDGGKGQVNAAKKTLYEVGVKLPVIGIAKGPKRKKNEFIGKVPDNVSEKELVKVRDEAHRFAVSYHRRLRSLNFIQHNILSSRR